MRTVPMACALGLLAALLAGCSAIPGLQPQVTLPVSLGTMTFNGSPATPLFLKTTVVTSGTAEWQAVLGRITAYQGISLTMRATNATGAPTNPDAVHLRFYVSDREDLTPETLAQAGVFLLDVNLPATVPTVLYDSGDLPLPAAAGPVLADGAFTLYTTGTPIDVQVQVVNALLRVKVRTSIW